jgi:hypothetical protein
MALCEACCKALTRAVAAAARLAPWLSALPEAWRSAAGPLLAL